MVSLLLAACASEDRSTTQRPLIAELCDPAACPGVELYAPNYACADGSIAGPACVANATGPDCHWEVLECGGDPVCTEAECGPAPGAPNYLCGDGTIAGPACFDSNGTCGWQILDCAAVPPSPDCIAPDGEPTPENCDPGTPGPCECADPGPAAPNYLCEDGQHIAGPACVADTTEGCGWQILDCPQ